jgi:pimeloyl-ACP methyl ester carboxylesterase
VVWGREDRLLPAALADEVASLSDHAEVCLIPSCGHLVMIERPQEMLAALLPFLERATSHRAGNAAAAR